MSEKPFDLLASLLKEILSDSESLSTQALAQLYFRNLISDLHVEDWAFIDRVLTSQRPFPGRTLRRDMDNKGFAVLPPGFANICGIDATCDSFARLAGAAARLESIGWPATFLLVFDEIWILLAQMEPILARASGGCTCNFDLLCWRIEAGKSGFSPHRDRQPRDVPSSFRDDGSPKYATCWVALGGADTPASSILYVIPRNIDPGYAIGDGVTADQGDDGEVVDCDPLAACLSSDKKNYQHIRALPTPAGGACLFSHRTLHWGSAAEPPLTSLGDDDEQERDAVLSSSRQNEHGAKVQQEARVSFSFASSDPGFEPPYLDRDHPSLVRPHPAGATPCDESGVSGSRLILPPLPLRLALACAQMVVYHERFDTPLPLLRNMHSYFKRVACHPSYRGVFHQSYVVKVGAEFASAVQDACTTSQKVSSSSSGSTESLQQASEGGGAGVQREDAEGALDEALTAALEAEMLSSSSSSSSSSSCKGTLSEQQALVRDDFDDECFFEDPTSVSFRRDGASGSDQDEEQGDDEEEDEDEDEEEFDIEAFMQEQLKRKLPPGKNCEETPTRTGRPKLGDSDEDQSKP